MSAELNNMEVVLSKFILSFSQGEKNSSYSLATKTTDLVRSVVECDTWNNADQLIKNIKSLYQRLEEELPQCHYNVAHNIIK